MLEQHYLWHSLGTSVIIAEDEKARSQEQFACQGLRMPSGARLCERRGSHLRVQLCEKRTRDPTRYCVTVVRPLVTKYGRSVANSKRRAPSRQWFGVSSPSATVASV